VSDLGIDHPGVLSGFTIRDLLIEVARIASGEEILALRMAAKEMQDTFKKPGTPSLSPDQMKTYTDLIGLAVEYQTAVTTEEPDGFTPEDERRAFAVTQHTGELMHAMRWLGGQRS
jgi:hypothetical protein